MGRQGAHTREDVPQTAAANIRTALDEKLGGVDRPLVGSAEANDRPGRGKRFGSRRILREKPGQEPLVRIHEAVDGGPVRADAFRQRQGAELDVVIHRRRQAGRMFHEELRGLHGAFAVGLDDRPGRADGEDDVGMFAPFFLAPPFLLVAGNVGGADLAIHGMPRLVEI